MALPAADDLAPIVCVRSVKWLSGDLWEVVLRTDTGAVRRVIVERRLATTQTVAMVAHAVATLVMLNHA